MHAAASAQNTAAPKQPVHKKKTSRNTSKQLVDLEVDSTFLEIVYIWRFLEIMNLSSSLYRNYEYIIKSLEISNMSSFLSKL